MDLKRTGTKREIEVCTSDNGVAYLYSPAIRDMGIVKHAYSTRIGGVSEGIYSSMNFSFTRGDDPSHVRENYRRLSQALGIEDDSYVLTYQTHTTNIRVVTEADRGKGVDKLRDYENIDGLITDIPGITLVAFFADCIPLYIIDPVHKAIGLSHSGRVGTYNHMGERTVSMMTETYGCDPADMIALIGPGICRDCYEVEADMGEKFAQAFQPAHRSIVVTPGKDAAHVQLDLLEANRYILEYSGLKPENIHVSDVCTYENNKNLFSHRYAGDRRGNNIAVLSII